VKKCEVLIKVVFFRY